MSTKELLKLGLSDLTEFLYDDIQREAPLLGRISITHAESMYKKFLKSGLALNPEILKEYTFSVNCQKKFLECLKTSTTKTVILHLFLAEKDFYGQLGNNDEQLQFAFQFDKKHEYYIFLNCDDYIEIQEDDFKKLKEDFSNSNLYKAFNKYISSETVGILKENTKQIYIEDILTGKNELMNQLCSKNSQNYETLYVYPTIQTINIFEVKNIIEVIKQNLKQLFSFGIMISTEKILNQASTDTTLAPNSQIDDRYRNCPPFCPGGTAS